MGARQLTANEVFFVDFAASHDLPRNIDVTYVPNGRKLSGRVYITGEPLEIAGASHVDEGANELTASAHSGDTQDDLGSTRSKENVEDRGYTDARTDQVRAEMQRDLGAVRNELSGKIDALAGEMRAGFAQNASQFTALLGKLDGVTDDIRRLDAKSDRLEGRIDRVDDHARTAKSTIITTVIGSAIAIVGLVFAVMSYTGDRTDTAFTQGQAIEARFSTMQNTLDAQAGDVAHLTDERGEVGNATGSNTVGGK